MHLLPALTLSELPIFCRSFALALLFHPVCDIIAVAVLAAAAVQRDIFIFSFNMHKNVLAKQDAYHSY